MPNPQIISDTDAARGPIDAGRDILTSLIAGMSDKDDATGLDPRTAGDLATAADHTAGVMETASDNARTGQDAFTSFDKTSDESAREIDSEAEDAAGSKAHVEPEPKSAAEGTRPVSAREAEANTAANTNASPGFDGIPGLSQPMTTPTSLPADAGFAPVDNPAYDPDVRAAQSLAMNEAREAAEAQQRQAQQLAVQQAQAEYQRQYAQQYQQAASEAAAARAQQLAASQASAGLSNSVGQTDSWHQATSDPTTRAALNSMSPAGQDAAMYHATEQMAENGGRELSEDEVRAIINDMVDEILAEDGGDAMIDSIDSAHGDGMSLAPSGLSGLSVDEVSYDKTTEGTMSKETIRDYILDAADLNGVPDDPAVRQMWVNVMTPQCLAESGGNPNAANGWDSNAVGSTQVDGYPAQSSRGPWQTIPQTFAAHHIEGTSNSIYDPQASAAAAMHYMMERYNISPDGEGLQAFAAKRGIDVSTGELHGGYVGY